MGRGPQRLHFVHRGARRLGARPFADGVDVIYYIGQENYPVEYVEREFPLRVERYAVRPDSGGPAFIAAARAWSATCG